MNTLHRFNEFSRPIFAILFLASPLVWELINDRNGDKHPNNDWIWRGVIMVAASVLVDRLIYPEKNFIQCFVMSFGIFILCWPWLINYILFHRKVIELRKGQQWYNHLSRNAWPDNNAKWQSLRWWQRLIVLLIPFTGCCMVYSCWRLLFDYKC